MYIRDIIRHSFFERGISEWNEVWENRVTFVPIEVKSFILDIVNVSNITVDLIALLLNSVSVQFSGLSGLFLTFENLVVAKLLVSVGCLSAFSDTVYVQTTTQTLSCWSH
jgi:hypothetical protein